MTVSNAYLKTVFNLLVTCLMWLYFTIGFALFFSWFYVGAYLFSKEREYAFQRVNHYFFRGFFFFLRQLTPGIKWHIPNHIKAIKSSVVVCNHLSYLDPLLLIVLFPRHKTIVKSTFFKVPLFGWLMKQSGFIPAANKGSLLTVMVERIESLGEFLAAGGNLFIFPEGTRSRDGAIGQFNRGAFKIAGHTHAPLQVLKVSGTGQLFTPGRFLFNASAATTIAVEKIGRVAAAKGKKRASIAETMATVRSLMKH
jgi:1-acyl-sn-glycerol-3-phosphate acyltransferase